MKTILCSVASIALALGPLSATTNAAFHFSGRVVDAEGHPVAGAMVARYEFAEAYLSRPGADWELKQQVTTPRDGSFDLALPRTQAVFLVTKAGLAPAWRQSWNARQDLTNQQLVATSPKGLAGVVVDEADKPVSDAQVYVSIAITETALPGGARTFNHLSGKIARNLFSARTGSDGRFRLEGLPDAGVDLAVQATGKALPNSGRESVGPDSMPWRSGDMAIKLVLEPAGSVEGKVVEQDSGRPVSDVHLVLQPQHGGFFGVALAEPVRSGPDGTFKIADVAAASYRVHATFGPDALPDWVAESVPVTVGSGRVTRGVQVSGVRGGLLQVRTTAKADRQPIEDVIVSAYREDFQTTAKSATNGVAVLRLLPGDYQVNAYRDNYRGDNQAATVRVGETNRLDIELSPPPKVTGVVRRPDGEPAVGAQVRIVGHGPMGAPEMTTDATGRFEAEWDSRNYGGMNSTTCLLVRMPEAGWAVAQELDEETGSLDLRLAPGVTFVGDVKSADGQPITNLTAALIFWTGNSGMHLQGLTTRTNIPGHFEIPAMPAGRRYGAIVSAPGFGQKMIHQIPADAPEGKIELEPIELNVANLKLSGRLLDSEEKPVGGATVNLQGEGQPTDNARTDRDGHFEFPRVCEGPVQLFANAPNAFGNTTAQGGETNVIIQLRPQESRMGASSPPQRLKGIVTSPDDKPAAAARVRLFSPMNFGGQWSRADSNGLYRLTSNPMPRQMGSQWLVAQDSTAQLAAATEVAEGTTELDIKLKKGGIITGRVQDAGGSPATKATIELTLAANRMESRWEDKPVQPDAQGQFEIVGLPTDLSYHIYASAPGYGRSRQDLSFEDAAELKVSLPPFSLRPANLPLAGQVVNEDQRPVSNAQLQTSGVDQPQAITTTDRQGRFKLQVCEGPVQLFVHMGESFSNSTVEGGETNAVITLTRRSRSVREPPRQRSLQGNSLPDLASAGLSATALPVGRPGLLCLLDWEQRPSRRVLGLLTDQVDAFKQKGLAVAVVQAVPTSDETWQELKSAVDAESFVIGRVSSKTPEARWATEATPLPWLILVNSEGRVVVEGFPPNELDVKIDGLK